MTQEGILSSLHNCALFDEVKLDELESLARKCSASSYGTGEVIPLNKGSLPVMLVAKGCIAVQILSRYRLHQHGDVVLALLMPNQIAGEFELLGDSLPDQLKLFCIADTEVISIPTKSLNELVERHPKMMRNLARSLVAKADINNFHFEVVSQSKGEKKIAAALTGFIKIKEWAIESYKDETLRSPMIIPIAWSIALLRKFLACDRRTVRDGLLGLFDNKLIDIEWVDSRMKVREDISINDLRLFGTARQNNVQEKTYFKITVLSPQRLDDFCVDPRSI